MRSKQSAHFICMITALLSTVAYTEGQLFARMIDRHNFGFVLARQKEIQVSTAEAKLMYHFELPYLLIT